MNDTINRKAVQEIAQTIREHRAAFNMMDWARMNTSRVMKVAPNEGDIIQLELEDIEKGENQCGTTLCIAGFAMLHKGWKVDYHVHNGWVSQHFINPEGEEDAPEWVQDAADYLGLPLKAASRLFHYTRSNDIALGALESIAQGVPLSEIEILQDSSEHCECDSCDFFPSFYDEDDDY